VTAEQAEPRLWFEDLIEAYLDGRVTGSVYVRSEAQAEVAEARIAGMAGARGVAAKGRRVQIAHDLLEVRIDNGCRAHPYQPAVRCGECGWLSA
jgi:hypothetical protein